MIKFTIPMIFLFLILIVCPNGIVGGTGAHQELTDQQHQHDKQKESLSQKEVDDDHTEKHYVIEFAITFSDGGDVCFERDYVLKGKSYKKNQIVSIENILADANGITGAKYIEIPKDDERELDDIVHTGAKLLFSAPIKEINVVAEKEGPEKDIDFHIYNDVYIKSFVEKLSKFDWRWQMYHGPDNWGKRVFTVRNQGHAMVALSEKVPELVSEKNPDGLREVARFHFNSHGLNLFRKTVYNEEEKRWGTNFIVQQNDAMTEVKIVNDGIKRFYYAKNGFPKQLLTKKISIAKMKEIALKIIGGRPWGGAFKCRHFAYNFVRSIVEHESLADLDSIKKWPENLLVMDEQFKKEIDGSYAFNVCRNFSYDDWVTNHLDKDGNVINVGNNSHGGHGHPINDDVGASDHRKKSTTADHPKSRTHG